MTVSCLSCACCACVGRSKERASELDEVKRKAKGRVFCLTCSKSQHGSDSCRVDHMCQCRSKRIPRRKGKGQAQALEAPRRKGGEL